MADQVARNSKLSTLRAAADLQRQGEELGGEQSVELRKLQQGSGTIAARQSGMPAALRCAHLEAVQPPAPVQGLV